MRRHRPSVGRAPMAKGAMSLVETLASILLVGGVLVAALTTLGAGASAKRGIGEQERALLLAQDLLNEILVQAYEEPVDPPSFGRESPESGGTRADWDDVDDYHGWTGSPPEEKDGTTMTWLGGWSRSVQVERVRASDVTALAGSDEGVKRINVVVKRDSVVLARLVAVKTSGRKVAESY